MTRETARDLIYDFQGVMKAFILRFGGAFQLQSLFNHQGCTIMDCVLCQPLETYEVCSFQHWRVVVNYNQNKLGKCMVCLNRHDEDICNLRPDEIGELWEVIRKVKTALLSCFQPDHFNYAFLMNKDAHVHLHVIPRYRRTHIFSEIEFQDNDEVTKLELPEHVQKQIVAVLRSEFQERPT